MSGDDSDDRDFAEAMRGVAPLEGREKLRPRPSSRARAPRQPSARSRRFVIERRGDDVFARAEDVAARRRGMQARTRAQPGSARK